MLEPIGFQIVGQIINYLQSKFCFPIRMYTTKDEHEEKKENTVTMVDK